LKYSRVHRKKVIGFALLIKRDGRRLEPGGISSGTKAV